MNKTLLSFMAVLSVSLCAPAVCSAEIVFTNFGPSFTYDTANFNIAGNDFSGDNLAEGDTFTPSAAAKLVSLQIALSCVTTCPDSFLVSLDNNNGADAPGAAIESFTVTGASLGPVGVNNPPLVLNSILLPTLTAGTQYWVTVSSDLNNSIAWSDNITGDMSDQAISTDGGTTYFSPSGLTPGAYQVNGSAITTTPEAGTVTLLAFALPLVFFLRRRFA